MRALRWAAALTAATRRLERLPSGHAGAVGRVSATLRPTKRDSAAALLRRSRSRLGIGAVTALIAAPAAANPFELFGASASSAALGQAVTARVDDWSALWHNPGGLGLAQPHMAMGTLMSFDDASIRLKPRPAGYDLPDLGSGSPVIPSKYRLQPRQGSDDIANLYDFVIGAVGSFGLERLRFGVAVALPLDRLGRQASHFVDEREQYASNRLHFELLGERSQHQVILLGVGYRFLPWLSAGAAFSLMPRGKALSTVYLADATRQQQVEINVDNDQVGQAQPILGVTAQASARLRLAASYRAANWFGLDLENRIQIKGFQGDPQAFPVVQRVSLALNYSPAQLAIGMAGEWDKLSLSLDAVYSRWSRYIDTQGRAVGAHRDQGAPGSGFRDVISVRGGLQWLASADRKVRLGLQWEPSPVPDQVGRSSYVDNDRLVTAVGASHALDLLGKPVELQWHLGIHRLIGRDTNKQALAVHPRCAEGVTQLCDELADDTRDPATGLSSPAATGLQTGSPGFPGWTSQGTLLSLGLDLKWAF